MRKLSTPGTSRLILRRIKPDDPESLSKEDLTRYQEGVGSLLYLLKHSRPELSNFVHELSKCMGGANKDAKKEMFRVVKRILEHPDIGLKMAPKWEVNEHRKIIWKLWVYVMQHGDQILMMEEVFVVMFYILWEY